MHAPSFTDPANDDETPRTILVAEDDEGLRRLIARELRADGFQVIEARDGEELLDHLDSSAVADQPSPYLDLVITDLRMPGATGLEALTLFGNASAPPIIVITAFGGRGIHQQAWLLGAAAVFDKPLDFDALRAEVHRQLRIPWQVELQ